ncbi:MAG: hypothetical protein ACRBCJ_12395 [Hyphomicrobiaceae bacterium]
MLTKIWRDLRLSFVSEYQLRARIHDNLERFPERHRDRVLGLAKRHDHLSELAAAFPALLFALAITENEACAVEVEQAIVDGRPLADLAAIASVPLWLRKLPPEAFSERIPELPDDADFRRRIGNHLPDTDKAEKWLEMVGGGYKWCDREFAIWTARQACAGTSLCKACMFRLALYAWFSGHPDTKAGRLIHTRWHKKMTNDAAKEAQNKWREDLRVFLLLESVEPERPWIEPVREGTFTFEPILTAQQLIEESHAMNNCLRSYADEIATREDQFWVVRKNGKRVAHLCIGTQWNQPLPSITEIHGPDNQEVAEDVFRAARDWFNKSDLPDLRPNVRQLSDAMNNRKVWSQFWRPYWLEKRCLPPELPMIPSLDII